MYAPPDPEMRRGAALPGCTPKSQNPHHTEDSTEPVREVQAQGLRRIYPFCHATACTVASLAFAVSQ